MVTHFDHVTIVVRDVGKAKAFFALLGFIEQQSVVIAGGQFARYMGIADIEAEHVTLALAHATPRVEVQLLRYRHPEPIRDDDIARLNKLGSEEWELCTTVVPVGRGTDEFTVAFIFKRPKR